MSEIDLTKIKHDFISMGGDEAILLYEQLNDNQKELLDTALMKAHISGKACESC